MITQAFISGQIGQAFFVEDQHYYAIDADTGEPRRCRNVDWMLFRHSGVEISSLEGEAFSIQQITQALLANRDAHRTLKVVLSGIDPQLDPETRILCIEAAEELLQASDNEAFVRHRLFGCPVPEEADIERGAALARQAKQAKMALLYQSLIEHRTTIDTVLDTWRDLAFSFFETHQEVLDMETVLIDRGVVAAFVDGMQSKKWVQDTAGRFIYEEPFLSDVGLRKLLVDLGGALVSLVEEESREGEVSSLSSDAFVSQIDESDPVLRLVYQIRNKERTTKKNKKLFGASASSLNIKEIVDKKIEEIRAFLLRGDINKVRQRLQNLLQFQLEYSYKEHVARTLCNLSHITIEASYLELAETWIDYAEILEPSDPVVRTEKAELLKARGDFETALMAYNYIIDTYPFDIVAQNGRAEVLKELGRLAEALSAYDVAVDNFPYNVVAQTGRAEVLKELGRLDEALMAYTAAVNEFPQEVFALTGRAEVLKELGRYEEALSAYDIAIDAFPDNAVAKNGRAEILRELGRHEEALRAYNATIASFPHNVFAQDGRAEVLKELGQHEEALSAYDTTIAAFPHDAVAQTGRAEVLRELGQHAEALSAYDATMTSFPHNAVVQNGRAEVLKELGRYAEALSAYEATIASFPHNAVAQNGRAEVLKELGRYEEALKAYNVTVATFPHNIVAQTGRSSLLIHLGKFQEARELLTLWQETYRENWVANHIVAMSYLKEGDTEEAIRRLEDGLARTLHSHKPYYRTALSVAKIAAACFEEALEILKSGLNEEKGRQRERHVLLIGHSQAALNQKEEAKQSIQAVAYSQSRKIITLQKKLVQRYNLNGFTDPLTPEAMQALDGDIWNLEFELVMAV